MGDWTNINLIKSFVHNKSIFSSGREYGSGRGKVSIERMILKNYKKGDEVEALLLSGDVERERISLGVKQLIENPTAKALEKYKKGDIVKGKVVGNDEKQISIRLDSEIVASLKISEINDTINPKKIDKDSEIESVITSIDKKNQQIFVSIKALDKLNEEKAIDEYSKKNEGNNTKLGDILED